MEPNGRGDGMKINSKGRLFVAGSVGVWILDSDGTFLEMVELPGQTTNCNWGDEDGKSLYITSGNAVYRYRSKLTTYEN